MGFGLLFIGYFITYLMSMNPFGIVFRILGYALICKAARKLSDYDDKFKMAGYFAASLVGISLLNAAIEITAFLYDNMVIAADPFPSMAGDILGLYVEPLAVLVFHIFLLLAIRSIAKDTDVPKIVMGSVRNIFLIGVYYLLSFLRYLPLPIQESYNRNMGLPLVLFYLVWVLLQHALLLSCYANICDEGDVDMTPKRSRFAFVNKLKDELSEKRERARIADEKYRRERIQKAKNKKK